VPRRSLTQIGARIVGGLALLAGIISFILAPLAGDALFAKLWGVEPLSYIGAILVMAGLGLATLSYVIPSLVLRRTAGSVTDAGTPQLWSVLTQQYFELFDHDLGRPMRRVLGKERELRFRIQSSGTEIDPVIQELLDEIERQTTNFRLMMSNIQVLVQLEAPGGPARPQPVEPSQVIRNIIDRYASSGSDPHKEITWWAEPPEFGIVYSDSSAIEHVVTTRNTFMFGPCFNDFQPNFMSAGPSPASHQHNYRCITGGEAFGPDGDNPLQGRKIIVNTELTLFP